MYLAVCIHTLCSVTHHVISFPSLFCYVYTTNAPINIDHHALYPLPGMGAWRHGEVLIVSKFPHPHSKLLHQLPIIIIGNLAWNTVWKFTYLHRMFLPSYSVVGVPGKPCSSSLLKRFNPFSTVFGTVRFLICSETRWRLNQWRTIKACQVMIQNVRKFIEIRGIPLLPLQSETVRATVPYFRRCFPVASTGIWHD